MNPRVPARTNTRVGMFIPPSTPGAPMTGNAGNADRIIRVVLAVVLGVVAFTVGIGSALGIVLGIVAVVLLVTAAVGFCPLYRLLGLSTSK